MYVIGKSHRIYTGRRNDILNKSVKKGPIDNILKLRILKAIFAFSMLTCPDITTKTCDKSE